MKHYVSLHEGLLQVWVNAPELQRWYIFLDGGGSKGRRLTTTEFILLQFWSLKNMKSRCCQGHNLWRFLDKIFSCSLWAYDVVVAKPLLVFLELQTYHSNLCLRHHIVLPFIQYMLSDEREILNSKFDLLSLTFVFSFLHKISFFLLLLFIFFFFLEFALD